MMESITYAFPVTDAEPNWVYGRKQLVVTVKGAEVEFAPHARPFANGERSDNYPYVGWTWGGSGVPEAVADLAAGVAYAKSFLGDLLRSLGAPDWVWRGVKCEPGWWRHTPDFDPEMDGKPWGAAMAKLASMIDWDAVELDRESQ